MDRSLNEQGSVVIFVVFMLAILAALPYAYRLSSFSRKSTVYPMLENQSRDIARGGILDATHWFRRQTVQPVAKTSNSLYLYPDDAFKPDNSNDPIGGSIDPDLGLVKEYEFNPEKNIWARHEIRRQAVDNFLNPGATDHLAAHDITSLRFPNAFTGEGLAWSLVSRGIVFERNNPALRFDQPPNRVISESLAYSEIKKITVTLPPGSRGAIVIPAARNITLKEFTSISGEGFPGILTFDDSGFTANGAVLTGTPPIDEVTVFPMTQNDLFGMTAQDLLVMSDQVIGNEMFQTGYYPLVDNANGDNSLFYLNGTLYGRANVLMGRASGIVFVDGEVHLQGSFRGLVVVNEGATLYLDGLQLIGGIFCNGHIQSGRDPSIGLFKNDIVYDSRSVQEAINANNNYREVRSSFLKGADR